MLRSSAISRIKDKNGQQKVSSEHYSDGHTRMW